MEKTPTLPDVSIVIVNWNTVEYLRNCLHSVFSSTRHIAFEVIVVDNGSSDGSCEMVRQEYPQVHLIANADNLGFPAANNQGIRVSSGRYILLLNSDTLVLDNAIQALVKFIDLQPRVGAVGGTLLCSDNTIDPLCFRIKYDAQTAWSEYLFFPNVQKRMSPYRLEVTEVDVLIGAYMMVRRETIEHVGGLDEDFFLSAEDVDWTMRIRKAGWKVYYYPDSRIIHFGSQSFKRSWDRGIMTGYFSKELLFTKHYHAADRLALRMAAVIGSLIRYVGWKFRAVKTSGEKKYDALLRSQAYKQVIMYALRLQSYESSCAKLKLYSQNLSSSS